MGIYLSPVAKQKFTDSNGDPLVGGKLYTYEAGTTTEATTYADKDGAANTNPVILDANGECDIWLSDVVSYKFVLKDADDVTQWTVDEVSAIGASGSSTGGAAMTESTQSSLTASGTITITDSNDQVINVGAASAITLATAPFSLTPSIPIRKTLRGTSDTNTVTLTYQNSAGGCLLNGDCTLGNMHTLTLLFSVANNRWYEESRSN